MSQNIKQLIQYLPKEPLTLGANEINFVTVDVFEDFQIGYRVDPDGNSLISAEKGHWQEEWYAIAYDEMGDPLIVDTGPAEKPVFTAPHDQDAWELTCIADSFASFLQILAALIPISEGRTSPADLENYPVPERTKTHFLDTIAAHNNNAELWFWAMMLEEDIDLALKKYSF